MANSNPTAHQPASAGPAGAGLPLTPSPSRPSAVGRHQVKRSLSELASPVNKLRTAGSSGGSSSSHHHHQHHQQQRQHQHSRHSSHHERHGSGHDSHHHHRHHRHHHSRHDNREVQSAFPAPINRESLDGPRPEGHRRTGTTTTMAATAQEELGAVAGGGDRDDLLRKEQERAHKRLEDLRRSLVQLHAYSTGTTRRLDETYYAVLEKTAALQMTFGALRDLAASSGDLAGEFDRGAKGLEDDIRAQLRGLGTFEEQEERIRGLQARIETGRTRMHDLVARVDGVRNRVERWEKADHEWQAKMRRRLRVIWGLVLVVILVVMGLVVSVNGLSSASSGDAVSSSAMSPDAGVPHRILRHDALNISRLVPILDEPPATTDKLFRSTPRPTDDNRLRQFDEL